MTKRTWVGYLNYYIFRWFGFRLARIIDTDLDGKQCTIGFNWIFPVWPPSKWYINCDD